jgi:hypothetical protein
MNASRRSLLQAIPMLAAASSWASDRPTLASFIKPFDELAVKQNGQNESRSILNGVTHSGDHLEVHETTLAPGSSPHPPHRHEHEARRRGVFPLQRVAWRTQSGNGKCAILCGGYRGSINRRGSAYNNDVITGDFYGYNPPLSTAGNPHVGRLLRIGSGHPGA